MKVVLCIDKNNGLMFNKRRISKDIKILEDIINMNENIYGNEYTCEMFNYYNLSEKIFETNLLQEEGINFIEDKSLKEENIENLIIYNFNKSYPSDIKLDIDLSKYEIIDEIKFKGNSHNEIIRTSYKRGVI